MHLFDGFLGEHPAVARRGQEVAERQQIGRRAPKLAGRPEAAAVDRRFRAHLIAVGSHQVAAGGWRSRIPGRAPHAQRRQHAGLHDLPPRGVAEAGHDLPQQGVGEVGVVPVAARVEHLLHVGEALDHLLAARYLHRHPDVAWDLALQARGVGEHPPDGRSALSRLRHVQRDGIVQLQQAIVAELHDRNGRDQLGDRSDPVLIVAARLTARLHVGKENAFETRAQGIEYSCA